MPDEAIIRIYVQGLSDPESPEAEALGRQAGKHRRAEVDLLYDELEPFDPKVEALKEVMRRQKKAEVNAEVEKLDPTIPTLEALPIPTLELTPEERARNRRERERKKAEEDAAYRDLYGEETGAGAGGLLKAIEPTGGLLKVIEPIRGLLGGTFGPMVGALADITSGMNKFQKDKEKQRKNADLLGEVMPADDDLISQMTAAAGPIGMIVAAALAGRKALREGISSTIGAVGGLASTIASPSSDPAEPIAKMGEAASKASEYLTPFSTELLIAGQSLKALSSIMGAVNSTAQRYGEFNPVIAQAQAIAEVRQTMGDFKRSQVAATELAHFVMAQSDLQQRFEDIKIKLLTKMLPPLTRILELIESVIAGGENMFKGVEMLVDPLTAIARAAAVLAGKAEDDKFEDFKDPTEQILNPRFFETPGVGGWAPDR